LSCPSLIREVFTMHLSSSVRAALRSGPMLLLFPLAAMIPLTGCAAHLVDTAAQAQDLAKAGRPVGVVLPKQGDVTRTITQPATVQGIEEAVLYAKASGFLKTIAVDKGDRVKQGQ